MNEVITVPLESLRDGYVQVSAFVAVTALAFGLLQYRTDGAVIGAIEITSGCRCCSAACWD